MVDSEHRQDGLPSESPKRVAVIVRTHVATEKVFDILHMLSTSRRFDVYAGVDETNGVLNLRGFPKVAHTALQCKKFGLTTILSNVMWHCGDYALYFTAAQIPDYDYYIMIEYDVDMVHKSPRFLERFIERLDAPGSASIDLVMASYDVANPDWGWTSAAKAVYAEAYCTGIFAFIAVSAPLLRTLLAERVREAARVTRYDQVIHCEAFCGSAASAAGYRGVALNDIVPGAINISSFHNPAPFFPTPVYAVDYYKVEDPVVQMVHPVFEFETYLAKQLGISRERNTMAEFEDSLGALVPVCNEDARLKELYLDKIRHEITAA